MLTQNYKVPQQPMNYLKKKIGTIILPDLKLKLQSYSNQNNMTLTEKRLKEARKRE